LSPGKLLQSSLMFISIKNTIKNNGVIIYKKCKDFVVS